MGQTKTASALEAAANIVIGLLVSIAVNSVLLPVKAALGLSVLLMITSFIRQYVIRRIFNGYPVDTHRY